MCDGSDCRSSQHILLSHWVIGFTVSLGMRDYYSTRARDSLIGSDVYVGRRCYRILSIDAALETVDCCGRRHQERTVTLLNVRTSKRITVALHLLHLLR